MDRTIHHPKLGDPPDEQTSQSSVSRDDRLRLAAAGRTLRHCLTSPFGEAMKPVSLGNKERPTWSLPVATLLFQRSGRGVRLHLPAGCRPQCLYRVRGHWA